MRRLHSALRSAATLVLVLALHAAAEAGPSPSEDETCPLIGGHHMRVIHFFFGRSIEGRQPLTDREWNAFASDVLTRNFPDGFTAYDGDGQWLNSKTGVIVRERSKIVTAAVQDPRLLAAHIEAVSNAYRTRFHQESVGIISEDACAAF